MELIIELVTAYAPSVTAILGVLITVITTIKKMTEAASSLKDDETIREVSRKLDEAVKANKELAETNKLLVDQLAKIKGYADARRRNDKD